MGGTVETNAAEEAKQPQGEAEGVKAPEQTPSEPSGGPDAQKAADGYRKQRDEARAEIANLQKQLEALQAKGDPDALKAELEEAKTKAEADAKEAEFRRVNSVRLIKNGCVDVDVALTLLDENGDVDALKEAKPWLFGVVKQGSTGLKPAGSPSGLDAIDKAMGLEPPK